MAKTQTVKMNGAKLKDGKIPAIVNTTVENGISGIEPEAKSCVTKIQGLYKVLRIRDYRAGFDIGYRACQDQESYQG